MFQWLFGKTQEDRIESSNAAIQQQIKQLNDTLIAFEKKILNDDVQLLQLLDLKFEKIQQRMAMDSAKFNEIQSLLSQLNVLIKEMSYVNHDAPAPSVVSSGHVGEMQYQLARQMIQEGQSVQQINQRTNLSRDEISILMSLVTN